MQDVQANREETIRLITSLGEPFAKALAVFIAELERNGLLQPEATASIARPNPSSQVSHVLEAMNDLAFKRSGDLSEQPVSPIQSGTFVSPPDGPAGPGNKSALPQSWDELPELYRRQVEEEIEHTDKLIAAGQIEPVEVTEQTLAEAMSRRLKEILRTKRISQKELARKLDVSPSVITKVLQHPERSKLSTLWRIVHALDVELHGVMEDARAMVETQSQASR